MGFTWWDITERKSFVLIGHPRLDGKLTCLLQNRNGTIDDFFPGALRYGLELSETP